ncbi:MAG: pimeloyl-CoA dehydrogenase large subunit [Alphaproteobacteria bacterium]|nr:pimeloyl-CoA dehydrogenase large subunit [Alphaproteobacteria bacterium]
MDLNESSTERAFRAEVRDFIAANLPKDLKDKAEAGYRMHMADGQRWHKILAAHGWGAPGWKKENGGLDWDPTRLYIWEEEMSAANCPPLSPFAVKMVGPVIAHFGTKEQKDKWLPPARCGEHLWCQGYSEPNSGSDLASLRTMAVRQGDKYVVNGMKIWNSYGHEADWMFALVRTSTEGKTQEGISVLLIDMKSKGISHRPIITIDGSHILNEIRFENVEVPVFNRIGEENKGWTYAKYLLGNERALIAQIAQSTKLVKRLKQVGANELSNGRGLIEEDDFRAKLAAIEVELEALRITNQRVLYEAKSGTAGNGGAILKSKGTFISQALSELMLEAVGYYSSPWVMEALEVGWNEKPIGPGYAKNAMPLYARQRANTIEGGTEEIQKNVIAKQVLGL